MFNMINFQIYEDYMLIIHLMSNGFMHNEKVCIEYSQPCSFVKYKRHKDGYAWRCNNRRCIVFKKYYNIRSGSFFEGFETSIKNILTIVTDVGTRRSRLSSYQRDKVAISINTLDKVINLLNTRVDESSLGITYSVAKDTLFRLIRP